MSLMLLVSGMIAVTRGDAAIGQTDGRVAAKSGDIVITPNILEEKSLLSRGQPSTPVRPGIWSNLSAELHVGHNERGAHWLEPAITF